MTINLDRLFRRDELDKREIRRLRRQINQISNAGRVRGSKLIGTLPSGSGGSGVSSGSPLGVTLWKNGSGGTRSQGYVVVLSTAADQTFDDVGATADPTVIGVLDDNNLAVGVAGRVRHIGYQPVVNVQGNVTAGDYLTTSGTAGRAESAGASPVAAAFAIALTTYGGGGAGTVAAFLFPPIAGTGGGGDGIIVVPFLHDAADYTWTDMPAALTELDADTRDRTKVDLTNATEVRLVANVQSAGVAGAKLRAQYSLDESSWAYLDGATGPSVAVDATGVKVSTTVLLDAPAMADVFLRVVGIDGDGAADPVFGSIVLECYGTSVSGGAAPRTAEYVVGASTADLTQEIVKEYLGDNHDPDVYPVSPDTLDDEFEGGGSIDGKWTKVNDPSAGDALNQTDFPGYLHVGLAENTGTDNFAALVYMYQTAPTGTQTFSIVAKVAAAVTVDGGVSGSQSGEFGSVGIMLLNSTNTEYVVMALEFNVGSALHPLTASAIVNSLSAVANRQALDGLMPSQHYYVKLVKSTASAYTSANTYDFYFSADGRIWQHVATLSKTFTTACDRIGLYFRRPNSQAGAPKVEALVDYFRRTA